MNAFAFVRLLWGHQISPLSHAYVHLLNHPYWSWLGREEPTYKRGPKIIQWELHYPTLRLIHDFHRELENKMWACCVYSMLNDSSIESPLLAYSFSHGTKPPVIHVLLHRPQGLYWVSKTYNVKNGGRIPRIEKKNHRWFFIIVKPNHTNYERFNRNKWMSSSTIGYYRCCWHPNGHRLRKRGLNKCCINHFLKDCSDKNNYRLSLHHAIA